MRGRLHHFMWHTDLLGWPGRVWLWIAWWLLTLDWLLPVPWWEAAIRAIAIVVIVPAACRSRFLHTLWIKVWKRRELRMPPVLDEDGIIRVRLLLPGETIVTHFDTATRRPIGAAVVRRNGSIRTEADWSHR